MNAWPPNVPTATAPFWTAPSDPVGCDGSPACHGATRGVPTGLHGCFVDYQDNVWVAGNGDGIVQKYTHDGSTLLLQIGRHGVCDGTCGTPGSLNNSRTLLNQPADVAVDPNPDPVTGQRGSIYIADGYGNHRVVVFDKNPTDCTGSPSVWVPGVTPVCQPKKIITVVPGTGVTSGKADGKPTVALGTAGSAWDIDFSPDRDQSFFFEADGGDEIVWTFDHALAIADQAAPCATVECGTWPSGILAGFGRPGHMAGDFTFLHTVAVDSRGNLFTGETIGGRRVQRFTRAGDLDEADAKAFRPAGYPDVTLRTYDPRLPGGGDRGEQDERD